MYIYVFPLILVRGNFMANLTLYVSDDLRKKMAVHQEISWSKVVSIIIEKKLSELERANKLAQKSQLTEKDVEFLTQESRADAKAYLEALLRENSN